MCVVDFFYYHYYYYLKGSVQDSVALENRLQTI